ncbi:protease HtpX [Psychrobacter sanguinis]|uniref:protease HtpX n=1 Tax=Psychrobacter sanguinis TaxID=861445 RepID=UPI00020C82A1|nr:protease HtpX [Psychrobacter sanguinis]EGK07465.1 heat shock protein HtpX [Psychrobacter sp. 1501(2011)]MCC3309257.1 protease HtpX [Psychrobacter sanguinis]MCD9151965.1 protease HtpX [Psychrobacter sanguinis]UEC26531.1 protease HtpX [Psychrobacter sanguinis]
MMRIGLFLLTNLAVLVVFGIVFSILSAFFGLGSVHGAGGVNFGSLAVMCAVYGMVGSMISLFLSKWMAKRSTGTVVIEQPRNSTEQWLVETVAKQAKAVNIDMPEVGIFDNSQPNAFATGWNKNKALVAVSSGLLHTMTPDEVEAVLAHEIGHVANGDMVTLALIQGVVNAFVMFFARIVGSFVDRVVFKNEDGPGIGYFITSMVMDILLGFLASAIVMWFSRQREFRADAMGAKLAGRNKMISALDALRPAEQRPDQMPESMQAFAISSGQSQSFSIANFFRSHPTLDDRIAALRNAN